MYSVFTANESQAPVWLIVKDAGCGEGIGLLQECYRILSPGGSLIITVPNMRALVKRWITGKMSNQLFFTNVYGAYMGDEADRHKWGFVIETLGELLESVAKWKEIKTFDFRNISNADIAQDFWILGTEAIK